MKLPKIFFTTVIKIPIRLILTIFTIPLSAMLMGGLIILFAPNSSIGLMLSSLDERVPYEAATELITDFVYKYNITFMKNVYLCDPAILSIIIGLFCYVASGGFKEAFKIYMMVCRVVFNLPLKDMFGVGVFSFGLIIALTLDIFILVYGFVFVLALAFPASFAASIKGVYLDVSAKAEVSI